MPLEESSSNIQYLVNSCNDERHVLPYVHIFNTYAKGRWLNRELLDVVSDEYGSYDFSFWKDAIESGLIQINSDIVSPNYKLKSSDKMRRVSHRHEPPVIGNITYVGETDDLLAVCKPASMPMHPCGAYKFNSLISILNKDPIILPQPPLFLLHRLDRVTSGLVVIAKSQAVASSISEEIRNKGTTKVYLAKVRGNFSLRSFPKLLRTLPKDIVTQIAPDSFIDDDRQVEVEDCYKKIITNNINETFSDHFESEYNKLMYDHRDVLPKGLVRPMTYSKDVFDSHTVGYCVQGDQEIVLRCPIGLISRKDSVYCCHAGGKDAVTTFRFLGFNQADNTSLVECRPLTGRTHQIRLHLQLLGYPIANDPYYGGQLFYGEIEKWRSTLKTIRKIHEKTATTTSPMMSIKSSVSVSPPRAAFPVTALSDSPEELERRLISTCRYCQNPGRLQAETLVHCQGIWLHALRYSGNGWEFKTSKPSWALPFDQLTVS